MNAKNKLLIFLVGFLLILIIIPIIVYSNSNNDKEIKDKFDQLLKSENYEVLYIAQTTCGWCKMFEPQLNDLVAKFNINYLKINIDKVSKSTANYFLEKLDLNELKTPYIAIIKNEEIIQDENFMLEDEIFEMFKTYNLIDKDATLPLNYIDYDEYNKLIAENDISIIGFSSITNYATRTELAKEMWEEISKENNIEINYFELYFDSNDQYSSFLNSLSIFEEGNFEIPLLAIIKNKTVISYISGITSKENIIKMLKESEIIN